MKCDICNARMDKSQQVCNLCGARYVRSALELPLFWAMMLLFSVALWALNDAFSAH